MSLCCMSKVQTKKCDVEVSFFHFNNNREGRFLPLIGFGGWEDPYEPYLC